MGCGCFLCCEHRGELSNSIPFSYRHSYNDTCIIFFAISQSGGKEITLLFSFKRAFYLQIYAKPVRKNKKCPRSAWRDYNFFVDNITIFTRRLVFLDDFNCATVLSTLNESTITVTINNENDDIFPGKATKEEYYWKRLRQV